MSTSGKAPGSHPRDCSSAREEGQAHLTQGTWKSCHPLEEDLACNPLQHGSRRLTALEARAWVILRAWRSVSAWESQGFTKMHLGPAKPDPRATLAFVDFFAVLGI